MKRCQNCNFQNEGLIDYCWQCGSSISDAPETVFNFQGARQTGQFSGAAYSNYGTGQETQNFIGNHNNYAPNYRQPVSGQNHNKVLIAVGGIFVFFLLFSVVGAIAVRQILLPGVKDPVVPKSYPVVKPEEPAKTEPVKETETAKTLPTTGKPETTSSTAPSTSFERMWVDYNVTENGRLGMRVHVKFGVQNMKGVDSYLAVYFEKADGTELRTNNKKFASKDGQVAIYKSLRPSYDDTIYKDLEIFMPYDELKLGRGKYDLKMDADMIYENGDLVEHLNYYEFQYSKS